MGSNRGHNDTPGMKLRARPTSQSSVCPSEIEERWKEEEQAIPLQTAPKERAHSHAHKHLASRKLGGDRSSHFFALSVYQALREELYAHYLIESSQLTSQKGIILPTQTG